MNRSLRFALTLLAVAATLFGCSRTSSEPAATTSSETAAYCYKIGFNRAGYYVRRTGNCVPGETVISLAEFQGLSVNRQCTADGTTSYYGLNGDVDSLDAALAACSIAGGIQDPGAR